MSNNYPEKKLVFVVTNGEYSDYRITGLYSTRELAEAAVAHDTNTDNWYGDSTIEEWFLDNGPTIPDSYKLFAIEMRKDGSVTRSEEEDCQSPTFQAAKRFRHHNSPGDAWVFRVVAKHLQHAIKIVNEKRVQYIASNDWPVDLDYPQSCPKNDRGTTIQ